MCIRDRLHDIQLPGGRYRRRPGDSARHGKRSSPYRGDAVPWLEGGRLRFPVRVPPGGAEELLRRGCQVPRCQEALVPPDEREVQAGGPPLLPVPFSCADRRKFTDRPAAHGEHNQDSLPGAGGRPCLLYTSDAADGLLCVDLGGRRIIKKKKKTKNTKKQ